MIHSTAIIDASVEIGNNVSIGPYSVISGEVSIADNCVIGSHAVISGPTKIGKNNKIYSFAAIGGDPQDKKYDNEATQLIIGDNNVIREYCTISRGTIQDAGVTRIGNDNWIMAYVHIAHDCQIGDHTIFANSATLAGHVTIQDWAILGGFTLVHQFCHIGAHCFTAMNSVISKDVPPFLMVSGHMAEPHGLNTEGLKRRGMSKETQTNLRRAYKLLYRSGHTLERAITEIEAMSCEDGELKQFTEFLRVSKRGIIR